MKALSINSTNPTQVGFVVKHIFTFVIILILLFIPPVHTYLNQFIN